MAIISRKISSFPQLSAVTGNEFLMVAYKGKTYKLPISVLSGNAITDIKQRFGKGDGANNPITITVGTGDEAVNYEFSVYNGSKGSTGDTGATGPKGVKGDTGVAIYNEDISDLIYNSLEEGELTEDQLSEMILSAAQGVILNNKLTDLEEVYLDNQAEYDALLADGEIKDNVKYFIYEEGESV
jgi:hypothetical protein